MRNSPSRPRPSSSSSNRSSVSSRARRTSTNSKKVRSPIFDLLDVMAKLRSPEGCPWDREQDHKSLRFHAVEEVYELIDAIESEDDHEMLEELGDLLLQ